MPSLNNPSPDIRNLYHYFQRWITDGDNAADYIVTCTITTEKTEGNEVNG